MSLAPASLLKPSQSFDYAFVGILGGVLGLHFLLLLCIISISSSEPFPVKALPRKFVVQTISLMPSQAVQGEVISEQSAVTELKEEIEPKNEEILVHEPKKEEISLSRQIEETPIQLEEKISEPLPALESPSQPTPQPIKKVELPKNTLKPSNLPPKQAAEATTKLPPQPIKKAEPPKNSPKPPVAKKSQEIPKKAEPAKEKKPTLPPKPKEAAPKKIAKELPPKKIEASAEEKAAAEQLRKKKEQEQAAIQAHQKKLLDQAKERIAKIDQSRDKVIPGKFAETVAKPTLTALSSLQIDAFPVNGEVAHLSSQEASYRDEVAAILKRHLHLPEIGAVEIKLTLKSSGKVFKVNEISSKSEANRKHIEKELPSLTFPPFNGLFGKVEEYTFLITLSNKL